MNKTLDYYNKNAIEFNENTRDVDFEEKQNMLLKYLKSGDHILDLGCGSGRDSKVFIQKGYNVTALDGSSELCEMASKYIGQEVICKEFKDLDIINEFDAVWACASLLHIKSKDLPNIINNISRSLKSKGYIYVSFKYGNFEGERNGRYFSDFAEESIKELIGKFSELKIIEMVVTSDVRANREEEKWLNVIVVKI